MQWKSAGREQTLWKKGTYTLTLCKMNGQNNIGLPGRFSVEKLKHKLYSGLCLQLHILMYRGERRRYHLAHGNVVKSR